MKPVLVQMCMPSDQAERVKQFCWEQRISVAEWVRRLIDEELGEVSQLRKENRRLRRRLKGRAR